VFRLGRAQTGNRLLVNTRRRQKRRADVIGLVAALLLFAAAAAAVSQGILPGEKALFIAINSLPDRLYVVIWPFMQYGVFLTIPLLILIALLLRLVALAAGMGVAGVGVYFLARVVKDLVQRGRPEALIGGIEARENFAEGSLGFPSGHIAVAAALTVVVTPYLHGKWRFVPAALAAIVAVGRMYVGAHTPWIWSAAQP
jgi:membrane-associated phospholipid phosphatase